MGSSLNVQLTNELRRYVDSRASDDGVYATPSEYIRDLIRRDMSKAAEAERQSIGGLLTQALAENRYTPVTDADGAAIRAALA